MPANGLKIEMAHWPYGLQIEAVEGGLLLRPQRKARLGWSKRFETRKNPSSTNANLSEIRNITNEFDDKEWEW
jgi:hypothetical protein